MADRKNPMISTMTQGQEKPDPSALLAEFRESAKPPTDQPEGGAWGQTTAEQPADVPTSTAPVAPVGDQTPAAQRREGTWPSDNSDLNTGRITPNGVGLSVGELTALDEIGKIYDVSRNALIRVAVRRLIIAWRAGELDLSNQTSEKPPRKQPRRQLKMPQ